MAKRTIRRNPMSVDTNTYEDYEESLNYFNFCQFNGINSNKNYVNIDQGSFEKAENVYVDQDNQLHTRPPLKSYNVLPSSYHVLKIFKVNNLTIYHVQNGENYSLTWYYNGVRYETVANWVYDEVKIINKNGLYIVFTRSSDTDAVDIKGFELYDGEWQYYTVTDILYIPETTIVQSGNSNAIENSNLLTSSYYTTVIFNSEYAISVSSVIDKTVTITITDNGSEEYSFTIKFTSGMEKVLTKKINSTQIDADIVVCKRVPNTDILVYLMYKHSDTHCYLSINGSEFYTIDYPSDTAKCPILSDDASQLFIHDTTISGSFDNGTNNTTKSLALYYINIQTDTDAIQLSSWTEVIFEDEELKTNMAYTSSGNITQYSCHYALYRLYEGLTSSIGVYSYAFGHSPENGKCVYMIPCRVHANVYTSSSTGYSESGTRYDAYADCYFCILYTGGIVHTYYLFNMLPEQGVGYNRTRHFTTYKGIANNVRLIPTNTGHPLLVLWTTKLIGDTYKEWISSDNDYGYYGAYFFLNDNDGVYELIVNSIDYRSWGNRKFVEPIISNVTNYPTLIIIPTYCMALSGEQSTVDFQITEDDLSYYQVELQSSYSINEEKYICNTIMLNNYRRNRITDFTYDYVDDTGGIYGYAGSPSDYTLQITYSTWTTTYVTQVNTSRAHNRISATRDIDDDITLSNNGEYNTGYHRFYSTARYLTDVALIENSVINYVRPESKTNIWPVYIDENYIVYYDKLGQTLYSSAGLSDVPIQYLVEGELNLFMPDLLQNYITIALTNNNVLYWTTDVLNTVIINGEEHTIPALYIEQIDDTSGNWQNLPDEITELTIFSQTSLGVFLSNNVYEFQYNADNDVYLLTPTKLQLGNKKGSEVLANYDGQSIFITNLKGLISLSYEDFVQSTEQVYTYLTENIMSEYDKFATAPIKLYQYKDWLFMYKENETSLYVYDTRGGSWWYWINPYGIRQIVFDGEQLVVLTEDYLLYYDFETPDFKDINDTVIDWQIVSQKMHFNAPNNYKHIRQLAIVTTQNSQIMRYKLGFVNYHNLYNLVDTDTVEYEISQLTTMIKRVTFMKTNAFQFTIKSDTTDPNPKQFVTPNIAIKYRITERVR